MLQNESKNYRLAQTSHLDIITFNRNKPIDPMPKEEKPEPTDEPIVNGNYEY